MTSPGRLLALTFAVLVVGLCVGYMITAIFLLPAGGIAGELAEVPELVGLTRTEARERVERRGLAYEETSGLHHPDSAGTIIAQEPLPGQVIEPGTVVRVIPSLGPHRRAVPDLQGLSVEQAEAALKGEGFATDLVWSDAGADVGKVIGLEPEAGTVVTLPATIRVVASAGARSVRVPDMVDIPLEEARVTLARLGLEVGEIRTEYSETAGPSMVLRQSPAAGTEVQRGSRVTLTVAEEPTAGAPSGLDRARDTTAVPDTVPIGQGREGDASG